MVAKPVGIASLIERVVGETEHGGNNLGLCGDNRVAVQVQEHVPGQERQERLGDPVGSGRREVRSGRAVLISYKPDESA